ncbi:MAG: hypothetical protein PHQ52_00815 [Candidatus Omnitrophica bacterium]|nr:hypothetical protein [Candidatus Omnitrophota bacterium]
MKKYIEPKIRAIKLDSEQAIIQVCQVGGNYLWTNGTRTSCIGDGGALVPVCIRSVRGAQETWAVGGELQSSGS